jgi:hypothetical protein
VVVPPFKRFTLGEDKTGDVETGAMYCCVVAAEVQGSSQCRQLLGVQVWDGSSTEAALAVEHLRVHFMSAVTGEYQPAEAVVCDADGWWSLSAPRDTSSVDRLVLRLEWCFDSDDAPAKMKSSRQLAVFLRVSSFGVLLPQRQATDGLRVGAPLLCSATAHTVSVDAARLFYKHLPQQRLSPTHVAELFSEERLAYGEPVMTALYGHEAGIAPDCYDYIFVSTFTGAAVHDAARLTMAGFEAEQATPHLPISCTVAVPRALP